MLATSYDVVQHEKLMDGTCNVIKRIVPATSYVVIYFKELMDGDVIKRT